MEKERKNGKNLNVQRKKMNQKGTKTNLKNQIWKLDVSVS